MYLKLFQIIIVFRYDWLEVHDGDNANSPLIGSTLCGSNIPQTIVSSGNELFVHFTSDGYVPSTGYQIRVVSGKLSFK